MNSVLRIRQITLRHPVALASRTVEPIGHSAVRLEAPLQSLVSSLPSEQESHISHDNNLCLQVKDFGACLQWLQIREVWGHDNKQCLHKSCLPAL